MPVLARRLSAPVFAGHRAVLPPARPRPAPAPGPGLTPKEAGYPAPFLGPAEQARRRREVDARQHLEARLLAQANQVLEYAYLPSFLVPCLAREPAAH